jgi:phage repressor protein C with HTH and peptisase S24 domain
MGNNLRKLRELQNWTHDEAAAAMKMSRGGYIKLERGERLLDENSIRTAAEAFGVTREVVLAEQTPIRIMGEIGAGGMIEPEFEQVAADGLYTVDLPFPVPDGIDGFEVKGDSMRPAYRPGDIILVWREQRRPTSEYIGEECAVMTTDGHRALKEIQRGRTARTFNLVSHNAGLIEDVGIEWVGEIYLVIKSRQIRAANRARAATATRRRRLRAAESEGMEELPFKMKQKGRTPT